MDTVLPVREASVVRMRASAPITALIPAGSIYGERVPTDRTYPFIRYGVTIASPMRASCWNGSSLSTTIHVFTKGPFSDECSKACAALVAEFDGVTLPLEDCPSADKANLSWTGGQIMADREEPDVWHGIVHFDAA